MAGSLTNVKYFLLDMDGTFNLGNQIINGSLDFIETLRIQNKQFIFLTNNSSKNNRSYAKKITTLGLKITKEKVFTSGEATAIFLDHNYHNAGIFVVGTPQLKEEFREAGLKLRTRHPDVVVLGFDTTFTYIKLWKLCDFVRAGLPYIATHPDFNCPTETGFMPDIGAIIAFVKASTGREPDYVIGKPNRFIVDALAHKLNANLEDMAMVGDRLYTDIALGQNSGITTCLVLSGETRSEDIEGSEFQPDYVFPNLKAIGDWLIDNVNS
jgi:HAD superfamily hydrolase (TIGR01457 family)